MPSELKNISPAGSVADNRTQKNLQQALAFYQNGLVEQAQALCQQVLQIQPDHFDALHLAGVLACATWQLERAGALIGKAIKINPNHAEAWNSLGLVLNKSRQHKFALLNFERAIALKPDYAEAWNNRGKCLGQLGQHDAAMQSFDRAIALRPDYAEAWNNRGNALSKIGQYDAALQCYDHALSIKPDYPEPHYNKSVILLYRNEFEAGWREYEWRWKTKKWNSRKLETDKPVWSGEKSAKRLLIWSEQGLGEQILFGSLLREIAAFPQKKIVSIDPRLISIFARSFPGLEFASIDTAVAGELFDEYIYLGGLPGFLRTSMAAFGNNATPFLKCNEPLRDALRRKIKKPGKLTCGLSWFSQNPFLGENKSMALDQLLPILKINHIDFVDLQYGDTEQERENIETSHGIKIHRLSEIDNSSNIDDLASLIAACDLVITTSNTTAHLAGALGQKTLLLAPFDRQIIWYWSNSGGISLWYPSIRVFEQPAPGDWSGCVEAVKRYLELKR